MKRPRFSSDLLRSEQRFAVAMRHLNFGRFEFLRIDHGEFVLDPWPTTVRYVKFASEDTLMSKEMPDQFELKHQVVQLLEYVRGVVAGEIRSLEIRHGIPFAAQIEHRLDMNGSEHG